MLRARLRSLWRNALHRSEMERNLADELQFHLEQRVLDLVSGGVPEEEAKRTARLEFGSLERYKEEARQSLGLGLLDELRADVRYALRGLARNGGFTATAVATLALGIGANTAVFSVVDALLIRELPVSEPGGLVVFDWLRTPDAMVAGYSGYGRPGPGSGVGIRTSFSALTLERFRERATTLSHAFAFSPTGTLNVVANGEAATASGLFVTGDYFAALGVPAAIGRVISPSDDTPGADSVAVISYRYWQRRFAGDPGSVGRVLEVNRLPAVIVGVTPAGFEGPRVSESSDITLPMSMAPRLNATGHARPVSVWWMQIMGRMKPGVTRDRVLADLQAPFADSVRESWAARPPDTPNPGRSAMPRLRVRPGNQGPDGPRIDALHVLSAVFAVVGTVLVIGCVNLANLLIVRTSARRQELSVRVTLGASRPRLIRQLLTESLLLALAGGVLGATLAVWGKEFMAWLPVGETPIVDARLDLRVLAFAGGLCAITAAAFGTGPALWATRGRLAPLLSSGAQKGATARGGVGRLLLVAQVAVSVVLLAGALLLSGTLYRLSRVDPGFDADNLLVFRIDPDLRGEGSPRAFVLYERLLAAIEAVPGVRAATMSAVPLIARREWEESVQVEGAAEAKNAFVQVVRWNFLPVMGISLVAGRDLSASDANGQPLVAIVNETMARVVFGDAGPVGRRFQFPNGPAARTPIEVVGVARDAKYARLEGPVPPTVFLPHAQVAASAMTVEVRTSADAAAVSPAVREAVHRIDPGLPLAEMRTQRRQIAETLGVQRALASITAAAAVIAILLACIGVYGLVAYEATRRRSEVGIRMALGAHHSDILRVVMAETTLVAALGALIGCAVALPVSRLLAGLLHGVGRGAPAVAAGAACALIAAACLAAYVPARRAARLDPTRALRYE